MKLRPLLKKESVNYLPRSNLSRSLSSARGGQAAPIDGLLLVVVSGRSVRAQTGGPAANQRATVALTHSHLRQVPRQPALTQGCLAQSGALADARLPSAEEPALAPER